MKRQWKRTLSFMLSLVMLFSMTGMNMVFAAETDSITECHPTHGEACGYIEAIEGVPCSHLNEDGSYSCVPVESEESAASPSDTDDKYVCGHTDGCGYVEDTKATPCSHICDVCQPKENNAIMPEQNQCVCTVKCAAADGENNTENSINTDCPICGVEEMNPETCKGKIAASFATNAASRAVAERNTILNLNIYNNALTDKDGDMLPTAADGIYDMLDAEGWKWDNNTRTLTLNGLNMNVPDYGAILLPSNAKIEVIGRNSIVCGAEYGNGITGFESLIIKGNGTIDISSKLVGIYSSGDLSITEGTVNVSSAKDSAILASNTLNISGSANVTASGYYCGLQANGTGVTISGATVKAASSNDAAIYTEGSLTISVSADVTATDSLYAGINAAGGITITDSTINAGSGTNYTAIYTPQSVVIGGTSHVTADGDWIGICADTSISIDGDAKVTATGKSTGLQAVDTQISGNVKITASSANASAISGKNNLSITGNADVVATGAQAGIVSNGFMILSAKDIKATGGWYGIDNEGVDASGITIGGKLTADATAGGHGIYSVKTITADDNADITAIGTYSGISTVGDITFTGSKVDAIGKGGCGITSMGEITITGGSIHAKASSGYTAIRTENVQTASEVAESKISLTNLIEKNGGKVAFSDWVSNSGETISWTTFTGKDDDGLAMVDGGLFTNGLLEIWLAAPYIVTFDVNGGSGTNSAVKVYPGNKVTAPAADPTKDGYHFSGWYLDSTKFNFTNTTITGDIILKAKLDVHTPNADDGNCTTAITCSKCGVIVTTAKTHNWDTVWSKDADNHWHKCKNANCTQIKDTAAHTWNPGEITTTATHTQDGVKTFTCTVCGQVKTEVITKLPSNTVIEDVSTGVKAEYEDGTPFDADIVLSVTSKSQAKIDRFKDAVDKAAAGLTLDGLYDISLLKDGVAIQPDGKVRISIPLTDTMKAMKNLQIVYIDDNGNVTIIPSEVKDGNIIFVTDHFGCYGVIGKVKATAPSNPPTNPDPSTPPKDTPQTGNNSSVLPWLLVMLGALTSCGVLLITKKRHDKKRHG